jgi:hypothetical protein
MSYKGRAAELVSCEGTGVAAGKLRRLETSLNSESGGGRCGGDGGRA